MKNSNENRKARDPVLTATDLKKRKFGDEYGDRTGRHSIIPPKIPVLQISKGFSTDRERDIRTLARHQIICRKDVMEATTKEFNALVATIINGRMWMGSVGRSNLRLFQKLTEKPNE
ncbi:unnamed protein product [Lactuca saligna]|uniref:Uncharacterized protein n=1 Tax=Lactuca saligna TaxID=75948 RepID=A0AA35Z7B8_LACSI|nr:unnamed protein product [Lactuca saligna]